MDLKTFLPDFEALKKTDWAKPEVDTKDTMNLVMLAGAALMFVFVFLSWTKLSANVQFATYEGSRMGVATWYGCLGLVCALAAVAGCIYKHTTLTFCAAVLGVVFGFIGILSFPEITVSFSLLGMTDTEVISSKDKWTEFTKYANSKSISHLGAVLYLIASVVAGAAAYLKITKK